MGTFISTITQENITKSANSASWSQPLQKIKEYHGMFKYVCDCFSINPEQFKEIFGSMDKFKIWDPESTGKIDALQIFCGLIIFAKQASFKKKLSFLFSIFDFNQIKSLSFIDLEVIILNVCNSVYKILQKNGKVNSNEIAQWLGNHFYKKQRIKITSLYKFCLENNEVLTFFKYINNHMDQNLGFPTKPNPNPKSETNKTHQIHNNQKLPQNRTKPRKKVPQNSQKSKQQNQLNIEWHRDLIKKIIKIDDIQNSNYEDKAIEKNYRCEISWVYGINTEGEAKPFIPLRKMGECIAYRTSSMAIIQDLELSQQNIIQGHQQQVACIAYNQKYDILATVQLCFFPNINLWKRGGVGRKMDKKEKHIKYAQIPTNHSKGVKLIEFVARETLLATVGIRQFQSPIIIYDYINLQVTHQIIIQSVITKIFNPIIMLQKNQINSQILDTFFTLSTGTGTISQIKLLKKPFKPSNSTLQTQQITSYSYSSAELQPLSEITTAVSCYLNVDNPFLKSFRDKSARMLIITGHSSGSVCTISLLNQNQNQNQNGRMHEEEIITGLDGSISCIQVSSHVIAIAARACIYIYDFEAFKRKTAPIMHTNLRNEENFELLSYNIKYFDFIKNYIIAMTEAGQFIRVQSNQALQPVKQSIRQLGYGNESSNLGGNNSRQISSKQNIEQVEQLSVSLVTKMIKFSGYNNIFCLLYWKQGHEMILFATSGNKILGIDSQTREIQDVWEISSQETIVSLDAVCSDQGICYIVCACKSGILYIRIDWEDSRKQYDCKSQIIDAKISRDCSYLLVATKSNYILFFAQVKNTFTSPRKILFEHQTPCSINFLDNFKFFLVVTSAKNCYLIQIPQLKHKKLQKQTEKISISKVNIKYPYCNGKKQLTYSNGCLGGSMKYSLLAMKQKDIYFFNSYDALQRGNYVILNTHKCQVSQLAVNELENKFYSLGQFDNTLIEWSVFDTKYKNRKRISHSDRGQEKNIYLQNLHQFQDLQQFSLCRNLQIQQDTQPTKSKNKSSVYYFKSTKIQKLNEALLRYNSSKTQPQNLKKQSSKSKKIPKLQQNQKIQKSKLQQKQKSINKQKQKQKQKQHSKQDYSNFKKRAPCVNIAAEEVYGFQVHHKNSVTYYNNGLEIMGYISRFILRMNIKTKKQIIYEPTSKKINFMIRSSFDNEIIYSVVQERPMIYLLTKQAIKTTHIKGIIHLSVYKNFVLSYGISQNSGYSLNLHNYLTGELLHASYTDVKVSEFIVLSQNLAVSLNEVRIWDNLFPSQPIALVSAGCLLPNNKDVLLGMHDGRFAILSDRGIYQLHSQIHQKAHENTIDIIRIKYDDNSRTNYQIVSVGRDEKIKIWSSSFQIKMMISFKQRNNLVFLGQGNKQILNTQIARAKSMDIYGNKILLVLHTGNIIQIELQTVKKKQNKVLDDQTNKLQNQTSMNIPQFSQKTISHTSVANDNSLSGQLNSNELIYKWRNIHQIHTIRNKKTLNRRHFFSTNPVYPLIATSACDFQIIIRNFQSNQIVCKLFYDKMRVQCVKFSPRGNLLAVGFDNGQIQFYKVKIIRDHLDRIQNVVLEVSQIFKQTQNSKNFANKNLRLHTNMVNSSYLSMENDQPKMVFSIINMQFSQCSTFFAVSYIFEYEKQTHSYIVLYRQSSSLSGGTHTINETDEKHGVKMSSDFVPINDNQFPCYSQADVIDINPTSQQMNSSKYIKGVYFMSFVIQSAQSKPFNLNYPSSRSYNISQNSSSKNIHKSINSSNEKKQALKHKQMDKNQVFLVIQQQYMDSNRVRVNNDNKIKTKVYQIQDKAIYRQDPNINYLKTKFPSFVHGKVFTQTDYKKANYQSSNLISSQRCYGVKQNPQKQWQNLQQCEQKYQQQIKISQMLVSNSVVVYGDTKGNLHFVKMNSLLPQKNPKLGDLSMQRSSMNLAKTYSSHTSFVNQIQISGNQEYLFVGGADQVVVKYRISFQSHNDQNNFDNKEMDLDQYVYNVWTKDIHQEYIAKKQFYEFLNNIDPIRDEISDIMIDVQNQTTSNAENKWTTLQPIRIFGRRALDKKNNLFQDKRGNLIYSLGPNIIIQDPYNPLNQKFIPADPNPYSNSPQISCMSMSSKYLIVATQQENSRIFVWDIYSLTCLSEFKLRNFSIVYHIVQSTLKKVILVYGVNSVYEPSVELVDWSEGKVIGSFNLMYSGCWKIKDFCQITQKQDGLQFVSCGVQHLVFWEYVADKLICSSFGLDHPQIQKTTFMTIKFANDLIITGCQNGYLYIFKNFQLICSLKVHENTIRSIAIQNQLIFSGGIDAKICVTSIQIDDHQHYALKVVQNHSIKPTEQKSSLDKKMIKDQKLKRFLFMEQEKSMQSGQQKYLFLSQQDIQSIVLAANSEIAVNRNGEKCVVKKVFVGTRSGDVFMIRRELKFDSVRGKKSIANIQSQQSYRQFSQKSQLIYHESISPSNGQITPILCANDYESICSVCFDEYNPDFFYLLTCSGQLQIWSLKKLQRLYFYRLSKKTKKLFCYRQYIIICCQRGILTVKVNIQQKRIMYIQQMSCQYDGIITNCCLSKPCNISTEQNQNTNINININIKDEGSQKQSNGNNRSHSNEMVTKNRGAFLAIGLKKSQFNQIIISQISNEIKEKFVVVNLKYEIQFMDFSRDCRYLLFKDSFEELGMVNLQNYKRINTIFVQMNIEWESEGIRISPNGQKIYCSYSRQNKIAVLRRISDKQIIIGDEMGTLRIFEYPCSQQRIGQLHSSCYVTHMNFIKNIEIHPSQPYAITTAVYDRSLILWKVNRPGMEKN